MFNRDSTRSLAQAKPSWVQETGRSTHPAGDVADTAGVHLRHSLWLSWMTPAAGAALPWWWDTHIEPAGLYRHFSALATFSAGEKRRGRTLRHFAASIAGEGDSTAAVQALAARDGAYGFVYSPDVLRNPSLPRRPIPAEGRAIVIEGLSNGRYAAEYWDTHAGRVMETRTVEASDGTARVPLLARESDYAFKLKPESARPVSVRIEQTAPAAGP
jgi:hypothetical protein